MSIKKISSWGKKRKKKKKRKKNPQFYLEIGRTQVQTIWLHCNECHIKTRVLDRAWHGTLILIDLTAKIWIHSGFYGERRGFAPKRRREEDNVGGATRGERLGRDRAEEDNVGASRGHWRQRLVPLNTPSEFADTGGARESTIVERGCTLPRPV